MITRFLSRQIVNDMSLRKVQVIHGARQVGRATLMESLKQAGQRILEINCDDVDDRDILTERSSTELRTMLSGYNLTLFRSGRQFPCHRVI